VDALQPAFDPQQLKISSETFVVVSTQGEGDEESLEQAARTEAAYVAFVASKIKTGKVLEYLREAGVNSERVGQLRAPAGLNIGAASPEEIAVSILAEIVQVRAGRARVSAQSRRAALPVINVEAEAKDPVCGMTVSVSTAKYKSQHERNTIYFCCAGCKQAFDKQPAKYLLSV